MTDNINELIKHTIQAQIVQALNTVPDAIEKLVKAALSHPVPEDGRKDSWGNKIPYLDYIVGEEIRTAATKAVSAVIKEHIPAIEEHVRRGLSSDTVVSAIVKSFVKAADEDWRIQVSFEAAKD